MLWGNPSVKGFKLKKSKFAPALLPFKIASFKSLKRPALDVSQNISNKLTTGSVSYTAKYCKPGVFSINAVDPFVSVNDKTVSADKETLKRL